MLYAGNIVFIVFEIIVLAGAVAAVEALPSMGVAVLTNVDFDVLALVMAAL